MMLDSNIPVGVLQELYNKLIMMGYDVDEMRVDTKRCIVEVIQGNGTPLKIDSFINILENDVIWNDIKKHVRRMDTGTTNGKVLDKIREGIIKRKVKVYSSAIGSAGVGMGIAFSQNPEWMTFLGTPEGKLNMAAGIMMLLMAGYGYVLRYDMKQRELEEKRDYLNKKESKVY